MNNCRGLIDAYTQALIARRALRKLYMLYRRVSVHSGSVKPTLACWTSSTYGNCIVTPCSSSPYDEHRAFTSCTPRRANGLFTKERRCARLKTNQLNNKTY